MIVGLHIHNIWHSQLWRPAFQGHSRSSKVTDRSGTIVIHITLRGYLVSLLFSRYTAISVEKNAFSYPCILPHPLRVLRLEFCDAAWAEQN